MPIIQQRSSGELPSLVNFRLINRFSLTDDLTFNSGTTATKCYKWLEGSDSRPALQRGPCSTSLCLVSVVTCGSARRLHNPFNLFLCAAECGHPLSAWGMEESSALVKQTSMQLIPTAGSFCAQIKPHQNNENQLTVYISQNLSCQLEIFSLTDCAFALAIRTSFFTTQGFM